MEQLALNFDARPVPNEHGVYEPAERIAIPHPTMKFAKLLEVRLLEVAAGQWISAVSVYASQCGFGTPLSQAHCCTYPTRGQAIGAALEPVSRFIEQKTVSRRGSGAPLSAAELRLLRNWRDSALEAEDPDWHESMTLFKENA